ncbi:MAG: cache domain-containing protein [Minisyncoccia bacterium]
MKISYKLILMFVLVSLVPIVSTSYLSVNAGREIITTYVGKHLTDESKSLMESVNRTMQSRQQDIVMLSENSTLRSGTASKDEIKKELLKYIDKNVGYTSLSFFDMNRVRLVDTKDLDLNKQHDMVVYWEDVLSGKISAGRDVRIAEELKVPIIYFASPVMNYSGKPSGVVVARYNPERTQRLFDEFAEEERKKGKEGSNFTLTDKDGNIIFSSDPYYKNKILKEKIAETPSVLAASSAESGVIEELGQFSKEKVITVFVKEKGTDDYAGNGWILYSSSGKEGVYKPITDFKNKVILLSALFFAIATLVGFLYSIGITNSLKKLVQASEKAAAGDLSDRAVVNSNDEFGYLASAFNQMLANLEEAELRLKDVNISLEQRVEDRTKELNEAKAGLEKTVESRTAELKEKVEQLEKFEMMTVGRELKMRELKKEIDELKGQALQP